MFLTAYDAYRLRTTWLWAVGRNTAGLWGLLRTIPTVGQALGQILKVVRNNNPNEGRDGCAAHV